MNGPGPRLRLHAATMAALVRGRAFVVCATIAAGSAVIAFLDGGRTHFLTGIILGLVLSHGIVSRDFSRGTVLLWLQKPRSLTRFHLERLTETVLLVWGGHVTVVIVAFALSPGAPGTARAMVQIPAGLLLDLATVSVVFGWSGVGLQPELIPSLAVILVLGPLGGDAVTAPEAVGRWAPLLAAQRFPFRAAYRLSAWLGGSGPLPTRASWVRLVLYPAAWIALGSLAVSLRARRPPLSAIDG